MAITLTNTVLDRLSQPDTLVKLILEVRGLPNLYGEGTGRRPIVLGDPYVLGQPLVQGQPFVLGQFVDDENALRFISDDKTTKRITEQLLRDQGASNSISRFRVELVDYQDIVTEQMSKDNFVTDILGTEATVYLYFENSVFPDDAVPIFNGVIDQFDTTSTSVEVTVSDAQIFRKQTILEPFKIPLGVGVTDSDTSFLVAGDSNFLLDSPFDSSFRSYLRIEDEICKVNSQLGSIVNVTRGQLGTTAVAHDAGVEISSYYNVSGNPIDIALKMMMTDFDGTTAIPYVDDQSVNAINLGPVLLANSVWIADEAFISSNNVTVGDRFELTGSINGNDGLYTITGIGSSNGQDYLLTDSTLNNESGNAALLMDVISQYNIWSDGGGIKPEYIDLDYFSFIRTYIADAPDSNFYLTESVNLTNFINSQLYKPYNLYSLTRSTRISVGTLIPPIASLGVKTFDNTNIENGNTVKIKRSVAQNFYNTYKVEYGKNLLSGDLNANFVFIGVNSQNAIKNLGNITYEVQSDGLVNDVATENYLNVLATRFLNRYGTGAESCNIRVPFQEGFQVEIGDVVRLDYGSIGAYDYDNDTRSNSIKNMEVVNKSWSVLGGAVELQLLDTAFASTVRYGVFSGSSLVAAGATTTLIPLKQSYGTQGATLESSKWADYINQTVLFRSEDFSYSETTIIRGVGNDFISVDALSGAPAEDIIIDPADYPTQTQDKKDLYTHSCPEDTVVSVVSQNELEVTDPSLYFVGSYLFIHDSTFSYQNDTRVTQIVGNVITLRDNFTNINPNDLINQIGFVSDSGDAYGYS